MAFLNSMAMGVVYPRFIRQKRQPPVNIED